MIHINESNNFYYNDKSKSFYFKNETSRFDYKFLEIADGLCLDENDRLPSNQFSLVRGKSKDYLAIPDEDLRVGCLYFGEFYRDNCSDISVDYDNSTCKIIGCFIKNIRGRCIARFAIVLTSRNFICFDIQLKTGEKYKKIYAYESKFKKVINTTITVKKWETIKKESMLTDYNDSFDVEVNFDLLERMEESGFVFKKWG